MWGYFILFMFGIALVALAWKDTDVMRPIAVVCTFRD
jgi:hypothetical protein